MDSGDSITKKRSEKPLNNLRYTEKQQSLIVLMRTFESSNGRKQEWSTQSDKRNL